MQILKSINIVLEKATVFGDLIIEDNKIKDVIKKGDFRQGTDILVPGFIDIHIHGGYSYDAMDGTREAVEGLATNLVKEGTTSFLATTMTQSSANITKALTAIGEYYLDQNVNASRLLGAHLEGPYVNKKAAGAQPREYIKNPDISEFHQWNEASGNIIKKVSLAPENDQNFEFIRYLKENSIIPSIAHTTASYQTAAKAIEAGASSFTHTFNAMTPLHHRDVGVVGAALLHRNVVSEFIGDKVHLSLEAMKLLIKNKTYLNVILITDSMRNKGLKEGISELGGQTVYIKGNEARLKDGTLAGSILKMIDGYRILINDLKLPFYKASHIASLNPAKSLSLETKLGSIKEGKDADLVLLSPDLEIKKTFVNGKLVYQN